MHRCCCYLLAMILTSPEPSRCPSCGTRSERIHSRYHRRLSDLPIAGKSVRLVMHSSRQSRI
ncbi:transposase family protein [Martelella sp.]|uniref:transposase family protein n=1 Tax=Martelella sp. TaxID=1969699 RepID=UPI003459B820